MEIPRKFPGLRRLNMEIKEVRADNTAVGIRILDYNQEKIQLKASIQAPQDTIYDGGEFQVIVQYTYNYPFKPPSVWFETKIWHPNINTETGELCIEFLRAQWTPSLGSRTLLLMVQNVIGYPDLCKIS